MCCCCTDARMGETDERGARWDQDDGLVPVITTGGEGDSGDEGLWPQQTANGSSQARTAQMSCPDIHTRCQLMSLAGRES